MSDIIQELQRLRSSYEFWQAQYRMTHNIRHYSLFQRDFREYCRLIDRGVVPKEVIARLSVENVKPSPNKEQTLSAKKIMAYGMLSRVVLDRAHRQQDILAFFENRQGFCSLKEIRPHIPVSPQHLRELLAHLVQKGLLEREKIAGIYGWRKKAIHISP